MRSRRARGHPERHPHGFFLSCVRRAPRRPKIFLSSCSSSQFFKFSAERREGQGELHPGGSGPEHLSSVPPRLRHIARASAAHSSSESIYSNLETKFEKYGCGVLRVMTGPFHLLVSLSSALYLGTFGLVSFLFCGSVWLADFSVHVIKGGGRGRSAANANAKRCLVHPRKVLSPLILRETFFRCRLSKWTRMRCGMKRQSVRHSVCEIMVSIQCSH